MGLALAVFSIVSGLLMFIIGLTGILVGDRFIKGFVSSNMLLLPNTDQFNQWLSPPVDIYLSIYIFNLKNSLEFQNGSKPIFEEIGPFVFKENIIKEDIVKNKNFTITYKQKKQYFFVQEKSPFEFDYPITTLNMGPVSVINTIKYSSNAVHDAVNVALKVTSESLLVNKIPAMDLIFGYKDKFLGELKKVLPNLVPTDTVGLFMDRNDTYNGVYTIYTGEDDYSKVGIIQRYNYQDKLDLWTSKSSNKINGTDGTIIPPFVNENTILYTFQSDLCRSLYGLYNSTIKLKDDIKVLGFTPNEYFYENAYVNPDNAGFCTPSDNCLPKGLLNLTKCLNGLPIISSCPHFLYSEKKFIQEIYGLKPVFSDHATLIYIEPTTGILMKVNKRVQFNTQLYKDPRISMTKSLPEVLYPLFWVDEHFEIDKKNADKFYRKVKMPLELITVGKFVLTIFGCVCFVLSSVYVYSSTRKSPHEHLKGNIQYNETTPLIF